MTQPLHERRIDVFFYGLFMDVALLEKSGIRPTHARRAYLTGFVLRIGERATLVPSGFAVTYGMLMDLSHSELKQLYSGAGLELYRPEAVLTHTLEGVPVPALCYNLIKEPQSDERNTAYAERLRSLLTHLQFPRTYVESLASACRIDISTGE